MAQQSLQTTAVVGREAHRGIQGEPAPVIPRLDLLDVRWAAHLKHVVGVGDATAHLHVALQDGVVGNN